MDASLSPVVFNFFIHQFLIKAIHFSCVNYVFVFDQTKMEGGTEQHLPKTDDWRRRVQR